MTVDEKLLVTLSYIALAIGILYTHFISSLYPIAQISYLLCICLLLYTIVYSEIKRKKVFVLHILMVSIIFKIYLFSFPASLIGIDPDGKALRVAEMLRTGDIGSIDTYYSSAPLFHLLAGVFTLISKTSITDSFYIFPIIGGFFVVIAYAIGARIHRKSPQNGLVSAIIISGTGVTMQFSVNPIPQFIAVFFWGTGLVTILSGKEISNRKFIVLLFICLSLALTHKIGLLAFAIPLLVITIFLRIQIPEITYTRSRSLLHLSILVCAILFIQFSVFSNFLQFTVTFPLKLISSISSTTEPSVSTYAYASQQLTGVQGIAIRRIHWLGLCIFGVIVWLSQATSAIPQLRFQNITTLSYSSVLAGLSSIGLLSQKAVLATRLLFFVELILASMIGTLFRNGKSGLVFVFIVLFLTSQLFTPVAVPDHDSRPTMFLNDAEVESKEFTRTYTEADIATDWYYSFKRSPTYINSVRNTPQELKFTSIEENLLNKQITDKVEQYYLLRDNSYYRIHGNYWELSYQPTVWTGKSTNRIYTSGEASLYSR